MPYRTTYVFSSLKYFFTPSEIIDFQIGKSFNLSLRSCISQLQQTKIKFQPVLGLFYHLFHQVQKSQNVSSQILYVNQQNMKYFLDNEGLKIIMNGLQTTVNKFQMYDIEKESEAVSLRDQMILKALINILYTIIYYIQENNLKNLNQQSNQNHSKSSQFLNSFYKDVQIDNFFIKLLTMSLEVHFIPIKKITMLYTKILANLFSFQDNKKKQTNSGNINGTSIYNDQAITMLPYQNTLEEKYLENLKLKAPPLKQSERKSKCNTPIQDFYRKHNMGDCPLAQSIVVGLLRSLLTICNSQSHKKFTTVVGTGADSFREWQLSYQFALSNWKFVSQNCSKEVLSRIQNYKKFDEQTSQKIQDCRYNSLHYEYYCHKIYTTSVITCFFMLILLGLKQNLYIQFSYFLQLISDANGILVLLKFLTDKFLYLSDINSQEIIFKTNEELNEKKHEMTFKNKVMLTVYAILNMLHLSCNNYPQKIKNYLFQYNSYLIIKKIPTLFLKKNKKQTKELQKKISSISDSKQEQQQNKQSNFSMLPSKQDLEMLIKKQNQEQHTQNNNQNDGNSDIMRKLTEVCYELLKIQIPFFSKKMKDSSNHMKMVIDIYCRYPKTVKPIVRTNVQKLILKNRNKKLSNISKQITMVDQMKGIHNQYNNLYYWSNDFILQSQKNSAKNIKNPQQKNSQRKQQIDHQKWLQENVWRYYD